MYFLYYKRWGQTNSDQLSLTDRLKISTCCRSKCIFLIALESLCIPFLKNLTFVYYTGIAVNLVPRNVKTQDFVYNK